MSATEDTTQRLGYLTDYLIDKLSDGDGSDFAIKTGDAEFAWIDPEDQEVVLVKLQAARFVVADP